MLLTSPLSSAVEVKPKSKGFQVKQGSAQLVDTPHKEDVALFLHTSGTTSRPKVSRCSSPPPPPPPLSPPKHLLACFPKRTQTAHLLVYAALDTLVSCLINVLGQRKVSAYCYLGSTWAHHQMCLGTVNVNLRPSFAVTHFTRHSYRVVRCKSAPA